MNYEILVLRRSALSNEVVLRTCYAELLVARDHPDSLDAPQWLQASNIAEKAKEVGVQRCHWGFK